MKHNPTYTYCLLQYRHSHLLGEVLNVGLLVYFPQEHQLAFIYPQRLNRITAVYPEVQEKTIKAYLKSFSARVAALNVQPEVFASIELDESLVRFISNELIPSDSTALQFDIPKRGLLHSSDVNQIIKRLYNTYFAYFDSDAHTHERVDDLDLISKYKKLIKEIEFKTGQDDLLSTSNKIQFDYVLRPKEGINFKFDVAWQNGSLNLVKPVSLDTARPEVLQNKAFRFYGQFLKLEDYAQQKNVRFDLLIAKPRNKDLFHTYDEMIRLLQEPKHVNLVFEEGLVDYSIKTVEELKTHDSN